MVYSSPANLQHEPDYMMIVACNTNGSVYVLKYTIGGGIEEERREVKEIGSLQLPKAVFSSPVWIDRHQFVVGCRNNYLYCININMNKS